MIFCSKCGKPNQEKAIFCTFCGNRISGMNSPITFNNEFYKNKSLWGALLILIGFFLPWFNDSIAGPLIRSYNEGKWSLILILYPICALLILIDVFVSFLPKKISIILKAIPLSLLFIAFILLIINLSVSSLNFKEFLFNFKELLLALLEGASIGLWATLLGTFIIFSKKNT